MYLNSFINLINCVGTCPFFTFVLRVRISHKIEHLFSGSQKVIKIIRTD